MARSLTRALGPTAQSLAARSLGRSLTQLLRRSITPSLDHLPARPRGALLSLPIRSLPRLLKTQSHMRHTTHVFPDMRNRATCDKDWWLMDTMSSSFVTRAPVNQVTPPKGQGLYPMGRRKRKLPRSDHHSRPRRWKCFALWVLLDVLPFLLFLAVCAATRRHFVKASACESRST